jgi:tetratricopeptide (TPR) repeat protein
LRSYELLTLRPAFPSEDRQELLRQIASDDPVRPRRLERAIPAELEIIVLKAMEKRPQDRYATAQELADDLKRWLKHEPIRARRPTLLQRATKWVRRHKPVATASAVVLLMTLMLSGYLIWMRHDRALRREAMQKMVVAKLDDSRSWQERRRLPEALSAAHQAMGTLAGGEADAALRREVESRVADLELLTRLEDVRLKMTTLTRHGFDYALVDGLYGEAFRQGNVDVDALSAAEAAERIRATTVAVELAAVLDDWALIRRGHRPGDDAAWKHLLYVARMADPHSWRTQLRQALESKDRKALIDLASADEVAQLLPLTINALAAALSRADAVAQVEKLLRAAQEQHPDDFWTNHDFAQLLMYRKPARPAEAISFMRAAVAVRPRSAWAHMMLGTALGMAGDVDGAITECREAIRLKKDYAGAHYNLGHVFRDKGQFTEALAYYRRGYELEKDPNWRSRCAQWVKECVRLVELDGKLPAILSGQKQPADTAECLALAQLCQMPCKKQYAAAFRFYREALADKPKLADDLNAQPRYNAACAAALAGCGQGKDADKLDSKERARLRQQALDWLRADLKAYRQAMEKSAGKAGPLIAQQMQHWLQDSDFAGVRGDKALAKLPEDERVLWRKVWADVAEMLAKTQGKALAKKKADTK